jgi:hypothetical protein
VGQRGEGESDQLDLIVVPWPERQVSQDSHQQDHDQDIRNCESAYAESVSQSPRDWSFVTCNTIKGLVDRHQHQDSLELPDVIEVVSILKTNL